MTEVKWPKGYESLVYRLRIHAPKLLNGTVVAIDPSSGSEKSQPGFAIARGGELLTSGTIDIPYSKPVYERLQLLHAKILKLTEEPPDVFLIEELRGQGFSPPPLLWSVGVSIAAARTPLVIEIPMNFWKSLAKATPHYVKGDAMDAEMILGAAIARARELVSHVDPSISSCGVDPSA